MSRGVTDQWPIVVKYCVFLIFPKTAFSDLVDFWPEMVNAVHLNDYHQPANSWDLVVGFCCRCIVVGARYFLQKSRDLQSRDSLSLLHSQIFHLSILHVSFDTVFHWGSGLFPSSLRVCAQKQIQRQALSI